MRLDMREERRRMFCLFKNLLIFHKVNSISIRVMIFDHLLIMNNILYKLNLKIVMYIFNSLINLLS